MGIQVGAGVNEEVKCVVGVRMSRQRAGRSGDQKGASGYQA